MFISFFLNLLQNTRVEFLMINKIKEYIFYPIAKTNPKTNFEGALINLDKKMGKIKNIRNTNNFLKNCVANRHFELAGI
jgi:hypothetical protein